ncbi:MAG: hypothetical protein AB1742_05230 [bacterium]
MDRHPDRRSKIQFSSSDPILPDPILPRPHSTLRGCALEWPGDRELLAEKDTSSKVVDAKRRFTERRNLTRFSWEPSRKIMQEVRRLVERRAGVELPWNKWPGWSTWQ